MTLRRRYIKNEGEFIKWYDEQKKNNYMSYEETQIPTSYPCVMMYAQCDDPMSIKGDIEYGFVYKEDLN